MASPPCLAGVGMLFSARRWGDVGVADLSRKALNIEDLRQMARRRLTKALFEFSDRGSEDEVAMRDNRAALDRIKLMPRILNDVSGRDPAITLFGKPQALPLVIGPTGPAGFVWYRGETALARAAATAGIPYTLSSTGNTPMEKILSHGGGTQWYQLYVWHDVEASLVTVERVREAGFEALMVTVDSPAANNREFDIRNGAVFPPRVTVRGAMDSLRHPRWLVGTLGRYVLAERGMPGFPNVHIPDHYTPEQRQGFLARNDTLTWDFLRRVRDMWPRTLIVKGILHPGDAVMAADCGADGIVVSNHAGNTNDAALTPIDALPAVVDAVGDRLTIIVDSGFRRGSDVLKGLALGADAVAVGRATLYGVSAAGEAGASRALQILEAEIHRTMGVMGLTDLQSISRDHVVLPPDMPVYERRIA
ncbi:MAG: alpha-hydroxy-acid oxidizing protein [Alphaproteobacteria bacterium]|nr:alpha-hydroxy-acid oxidizing protein [Alphaproteobacteria bacterium]